MSLNAGRVFVASMGISAALFAGCGNERKRSDDDMVAGDGGTDASDHDADSADDAGAEPDALSPFDAWREVQAALVERPDHRVARAEALVAQRDPEQIFLFVRDTIVTYPPTSSSFENILYAQRWGVRGTLRGGAGTPREKVELLASLYQRAGFEVEVVRGTADPACLTGSDLLLGARPDATVVPFSAEQTTRWRTALGDDPPKARKTIDPDGTRAAALSDSLLAKLPSDLAAPFDFALDVIPLVRVKVGDEWQFANPLAKGARFGEPCAGETTGISGPNTPDKVFVRLEAALADAPYARFTLVERSYESDEVVGRKIHLSFAPPVATEELLGMRPEDVTSFVPMLTVAGPDMTQEERDALAVAGDVFTVHGDHYTADPASGALSVNGHQLAAANVDSTQVARVDSVSAAVQASAFPSVTLRLSTHDAGGLTVPALPASAFAITEGGANVPFQLVQNEAPPPRVVFLFDLSTSVPVEFRDTGAVTVANDIFTELYAAHPDAQVRVATISFGANFAANTWATTLDDAKEQAATLPGSLASSEIWEALRDVAELDPTLIVLITDGDATDELLPEFRDVIASGPPVVTLGVGTVKQEIVDQITELANGESFAITQQSQAVDTVLARIDAHAVQDYEIRYQAPREGPSTRTVRVVINGKVFEGNYEVPATPATAPVLSGLYLTLRVGDREVTRAIAGLSRGYTTADVRPTQEMLADVRATLLGRVSIAVEAAPPSPGILLDDWIADKLALEPLWQAIESKDYATFVAALDKGFNVTPSKLPLALSPVPQLSPTTSLTFEDGLRVAAFVQKASPGAPFRRALDLFPLTRFATANADPRQAFVDTLRATASLAVMEAELMTGASTLEALEDVPLTLLNPGGARDQAGLTDEQRLQWAALEELFSQQYQLLVPLAPGPFWAIDETTGSVIGILADGSGGGLDTCGAFNAANGMIDALGLMGGLAGAAVGGWAALAKWEVRMVTLATLVISGEGGGIDPGNFTNPAAEMGCGMLDDALGDAIPGYGDFGTLDDVLGGAGVDTGAPDLCDSLGLGMSGGTICGG